MKRLALCVSIGVLLSAAALAQERPRFMFDLGTGFTAPSNVSADNLNIGWNVQGGVGASVNLGLARKSNCNTTRWVSTARPCLTWVFAGAM